MGSRIERSETSLPVRGTQTGSSKLSPLAKFSRKELIVIFSLCLTLLIGIVSKYAVEYHWNTPNIEIIQPVMPEADSPWRTLSSSEQIKFQLDINKAEWYGLVLLPKVGEVRAKAIVAYREKHGEFQNIEQLLNVKGINGSVIDAIRDYVKIE